MTRYINNCALWTFVIAFWLPTSTGFSAHLSRPWEPPIPNTLLVTRKRRWKDSETQLSDVSAQKGADEAATDETALTEDDDEEETMALQDANDGPRVFLASPTGLSAPAAATAQQAHPEPTIRSSLPLLWGMCRPANFPGVLLFHVLGVHLALAQTSNSAAQLLPTLLRPSMVVVLVALLLTSSTSMVVNDYYDNKSGVDSLKIHKPLVGGTVPMAVAKGFLYYLYAALLLTVAVVPGVPARFAVISGVILTFWYTKHLKPITWLKNVVCASLIALSPLTSGAAAFHLTSPVGQSSLRVIGVQSLWRLVGMLFAGFLGREIIMDINDVVDDRLHRVRTLPVKYGRKYASGVALVCTSLMALGALAGPLYTIITGTTAWKPLLPWMSMALPPSGVTRQLLLASIGGSAMVYRAYQVFATEGEDRDVVDRAIEAGKITILFLLASFI